MCGRFALNRPLEAIGESLFGIPSVGESHAPRYNIPPGTPIPAFRSADEHAEAAVLDWPIWGFKPRWADTDGPAPINARAERVATTPYFKRAFSQRRCLIPASGFFEWRQEQTGKQPYFITLRDDDPDGVMLLAGLWEWIDEHQTCCAILTEPASPALRTIHDRQPVILDPACRWDWLEPALTEREAIRNAARRLDPARLTLWPVSARVNKSDNDDAELLAPCV